MSSDGLFVVVHDLTDAEKNAVKHYLKSQFENGFVPSKYTDDLFVHFSQNENALALFHRAPNRTDLQAAYDYLESCLDNLCEQQRLAKRPKLFEFLGGGTIKFR